MNLLLIIVYVVIPILVTFFILIVFRKKVTMSLVLWGVVMTASLILLVHAIFELLYRDTPLFAKNNMADEASIISSICILLSCAISLRKEWKKQNRLE